jgi:hypothetical protein
MNTIQAEWENFSKGAISPLANSDQIADAKMAFYAGAWSMMGMQHRLVEEGYSENAGVAIMGGVYEEMTNFFKSLEASDEK